MKRVGLLIFVLGLLASPAQSHARQPEQRVTRLVSVNPSGVGSDFGICVSRYQFPQCRTSVSTDARVVVFEGDDLALYRSEGGQTRLISIGPTGVVARDFADGFCAHRHACTFLLSGDGRRVYFETGAALTANDGDRSTDIYEWDDGVVTLVTPDIPPRTIPLLAAVSADGSRLFYTLQDTGDEPRPGDCCSGFFERTESGTQRFAGHARLMDLRGASADGRRLFFTTDEALDPRDTDSCSQRGCIDLYERTEDGAIRMISTGPLAGNGDGFDATAEAIARDGRWAIFSSAEQLVPGAPGGGLYEWRNGVVSLIAAKSDFLGASADGRRVYFQTALPLTSEDTDSCLTPAGPGGCRDIYEYADGRLGLVSTFFRDAPNGLWYLTPSVSNPAVSADGSHLLFTTFTSLSPEDFDACDRGSLQEPGCRDVYEWSSDGLELVSTGPTGANAPFDAFPASANSDFSRLLFTTQEALVPDDADVGSSDLYERAFGRTVLVTTRSSDPSNRCVPGEDHRCGDVIGTARDGRDVFFWSRDRLTAQDTDGAADIYVSSAIGPGCQAKQHDRLPKKCG